MRKYGVAMLAVAVALAAPTIVSAAGKKFQGVFETGGSNSFTLKKTKNGKKVFNYEWAGFVLDCAGGPETSSNGLTFKVAVKRHKFEAVASPSSPEKAKLSIKGKFTSKATAKGTMRMQGSKVPVDGGGRDKCDSGRVGWDAQRLSG